MMKRIGQQAILFPLLALGSLALLSFWISNAVQSEDTKKRTLNVQDPDYMMENFLTTRTDQNGQLQYRLAAVDMKHYPADDTIRLTRPKITRYDGEGPYTQIASQRGFVLNNGEDIEFVDHVNVYREASSRHGEMTMTTSRLTVKPKIDLATTDQAVTITQAPKTVIHAIGMVFDKKRQTVKLLKKVRAHYENPKATRHLYLVNKPVRDEKAMKLESHLGDKAPSARSKISPAPTKQPSPDLKMSKDF